jgi:Tol biopolymer transport system component
MEMWVLDARLDRPAARLDAAIDEGPAVSRLSPRIAWTGPGQREMFMADIVYEGGTPALANPRRILSYDADARPQTMRLETQDFRPPDERELLFTCYSGTEQEPFYFADVCGLDLATGAVRNYTSTPEQYDEAEGVFADGRSILVESDRHTRNREWRIDLYRVPLDGTNRGDRLTTFSGPPDTPYHGSDGVISPDGRFMAFQLGVRGPQAGQGWGILLMDLSSRR